MSAVATETTCLGLTSMYSIWSARASGNWSRKRDGMRSSTKWRSASRRALACATTCSSSSSAGRYSIWSVTIGRIGNALSFCFLSSAAAPLASESPFLTMTSPPLAMRSVPAS